MQHYPFEGDLPADTSSVTILFNTEWGLQVCNPHSEEWQYVPPARGTNAIVNIGDTANFLTAGRLKSCLHRIVPYLDHWTRGSRYAIIFFLRANNQVEFEDLEGQRWNAHNWLNRKFLNYRSPHKSSIKGVVYAAMVLKTAMGPKVEAALVLDKVLCDISLDFFIMTSGISAVLGNQGQANCTEASCAAVNSFLDFLALRHRRQGFFACSLALSMVEDAGVVAENNIIADKLALKMPFGIDEREMLSGFESAIIQGASSGNAVQLGDVQLILGLEPPAMLEVMEGLDLSDACWYKDERMRPILEELEALATLMSKTGGLEGLESFTSKLVGLSSDESLLAIGSHIMERSARIVGAQAGDFQYESIFISSYGVDYVIDVELHSWLFKEIGVQVSIQVISGTNTAFAGLDRIISEHLGIV
ncbi:hypothetical protein LX32DRAFT_695432 [Colletotrichum zoysiae]|uniref:Fe2OG dioxygenase domain-containing protein n=1 Tax=Colletotrichum zoysiae TaxID=1216348 RepID=A0AAD9LY32_9PEZI|nr:hypothetical protein LX32DRAFT_695432 [Colletotrichum zoysiae]